MGVLHFLQHAHILFSNFSFPLPPLHLPHNREGSQTTQADKRAKLKGLVPIGEGHRMLAFGQ